MTEPYQDDDYLGNWIDCGSCGGEGYLEDECECEGFVDICCCAKPTPAKCRHCDGKGGWEFAQGQNT